MLRLVSRALTVGLALTALAVQAVPASSQSFAGVQPGDVLSVTVTFGGAPAAGIPVELHHITNEGAGQAASGVTDASGRFRFTLQPDPDLGTNVFFVTAEKSGIRYFGVPLHADSELPAEYPVEVFDTASSVARPIRIPSRNVFMAALPEGNWEVNELIRITNENDVALVAPAGTPTFNIRIPEGASDFEVGEASILESEVALMEDRVMLLTPVTPGSRDLLIRYRLPARPTRASVPIGEPTDTFNLYVQQPSHLTEVVGLPSLSRMSFEGKDFLRYGATDLQPASSIDLAWSGAGSSPVNPVVAAVVVTILLLAFGGIAAARNRSVVPGV